MASKQDGTSVTKKSQPTKKPAKEKESSKNPIRRNKIHKEKFPQYLVEGYGILNYACKIAHISRTTYHRWRTADPEFAKACDEAIVAGIEEGGDFVESKLYDLITQLNPSAIIFYCKTKLRHRGYAEKKEIDTTDNSAILESLAAAIKNHEKEY